MKVYYENETSLEAVNNSRQDRNSQVSHDRRGKRSDEKIEFDKLWICQMKSRNREIRQNGSEA